MNETLDNLVSATLINLAETGYSDSIIAEHRRAYAHSCYDDQLAAYEAYLSSTRKTEKDVRSRTHCAARFLKFIENHKIMELSAISAEDIYAAFQEASDKNRFRRLVGHFLKYAYRYGLTGADLYQFVPAAVRHKAVPSVYSPEDTQRKTGEPLTLPLLGEVKEALHDYLDNVRPAQDDCHIFLKVCGKGPMSPANIGKVVELAFNSSGVDCGTRRRGSHSLRAPCLRKETDTIQSGRPLGIPTYSLRNPM